MLFPSAHSVHIRPLRHTFPSAALFTLLFLTALPSVSAQVGGTDGTGTGGQHSIQARLVGPSGRRSDLRLKVRLESSGSGDLYVFSDANGTCRFTGLRPGSYTLVVEGGEDFETARESVTIDPSTIRTSSGVIGIPFVRPISLQIYLRPKREDSSTTPPGVLNASLANVPKPAADLYLKGVEAVRRNENERGADLLRQAVETHQSFPLALTELGVTYLKLKRPEKAAETLAASLKVAPEEHWTLLAYGRALLELRRSAEAEEQFRKALKRNPASASAHLYLGMVLLGRREFEESERELQTAAQSTSGEAARAHYYLGGLYWELKQYKRAADELETYLKLAPTASDAARLRATIKELRTK